MHETVLFGSPEQDTINPCSTAILSVGKPTDTSTLKGEYINLRQHCLALEGKPDRGRYENRYVDLRQWWENKSVIVGAREMIIGTVAGLRSPVSRALTLV